jgi:catalase
MYQVKSLAFVKGEMKVNSDLPQYLQQGIFQPGATYPLMARYANEPSFVQPDTENAPRGLGMKVFDVKGERLDDNGEGTQDFLFNNAPMVELTDVKTTLEITSIRERNFDDPAQLKKELGKRSDSSKQFAPSQLPNTYLLGNTMYSQCQSLSLSV